MAWSFINAGTIATGASPVPGIPASYASGDLFLVVASSSTVTYSSSLTGYTNLINSFSSGNASQAVWWKVAGSSESAPTLTNTDTTCAAVICAWRTVDTSSVDATGAFSRSGTASVTPATVNCSVPNDLLIHVIALLAGGSGSVTPVINSTTRATQAAASGQCGLYVGDESYPQTGASPSRLYTYSASSGIGGASIAFRQLQPTITVQPAAQTVTPGKGSTAAYSVTATASAGSLSYQWYKNNGSIGGATSSSYSFTPQHPADYEAELYCAVTDSNSTLNSNTAPLLFNLPRGFTKRPTQLLGRRAQDFKSELTVKRWF